MPRLSKIGAAALGAFGWTGGAAGITANYLVVAGGGAGGTADDGGGGGGAGGLRSTVNATGGGGSLEAAISLNATLSYTVVVGAGGAGVLGSPGTGLGNNGSASSFSTVSSVGGGGGGGQTSGIVAGNSGGSGGGGGQRPPGNTAGSGTTNQGYAGGNGTATNTDAGGGGGGAGAVGSVGTAGNVGGNGGVGVANSITGTSTFYGGGGGAGGGSGQGSGGTGGGGVALGTGSGGSSGTANTGGGGGASNAHALYSGNGGSGVVIISYASPQKFGGGIVTTSGANTIHTFQTSGTLSPLSSLSASYLIVAGGGGGGFEGGGGAGGMQTGTGVTIDTNSIYLVTVGSGGAGNTSGSGGAGVNGSNSSFSIFATSSVGGGGGGNGATTKNGLSGGSGGGGSSGGTSGSPAGGTGGSATSGQGNAGGTGGYAAAAGGGGAGAVGGNATSGGPSPSYTGAAGGNGGNGLTSSISGTSTYYAGGGGGGCISPPNTQGTGGLGGGGAGANGSATSGTTNTGGGGGGSWNSPSGNGGSGVVIISYAGSTQQMAGGTVTISGGNVIHTFTSSGYLTPLKLVNNSLRFRSSASANLTRQPTVTGSQTTATYSFWLKRGSLGALRPFHTTKISSVGTNATVLQFNSSDQLNILFASTGGTNYINSSTAVYRDPASWYHVVVAIDTTQASSANRFRAYVNGIEITSWASSSIPPQSTNLTLSLNSLPMNIGTDPRDGTYYDGEMTEINFIDGQQLTPNSFGTFNSYGVWQPITYGGSYGTNGFYLPFTNKTSTTTLGYDFSPAGNNWTTNNISLTAGVTYDSMTDVPTLTSATVANYAVLNPIIPSTTNLINGNLTRNGSVRTNVSTAAVIGGKFYFETTIQDSNGNGGVGVKQTTAYPLQDYDTSKCATYFANGEYKIEGASQTSGFSSYTNGDVIGCAVDSTVSPSKIWWSKNGTWQGTGNPTTAGYSLTAGLTYYFMVLHGSGSSSTTASVNFGQQPFAYTIPSGYTALNTFNL